MPKSIAYRAKSASRLLSLFILAELSAPLILAHLQPTTLVLLDVDSSHVRMSLLVPLPELELAFGHDVTKRPEQRLASWEAPFGQYLREHIRPVTPEGRAWDVQVLDVTVGKAEQAQSGPFQEVTVNMILSPPAGGSVRDFVLRYDLLMHQVVTHKALVSVQSDWANGTVEPVQVGRIAVDTGTTRIEPLRVHLGVGSAGQGFRAMVLMGMQHIREGTDHVLFLLVLLLPATLIVAGGNWGSYGGARYSAVRVIRIVTAFTLGHSATLLAGALHIVRLPQKPVEVLIAVSILVSAVHALRPVFPDREPYVAAGFGLVHGLAFASVLANLHLSAGPMGLSILGFNLGIELMQLLVIAVTMPWLILISQTAAHPWVRTGGALFAIVASLGWIVNRLSGASNAIERAMNTVTEMAPAGLLILAAIAIPSYVYTLFRATEIPLEQRKVN